MAGLPLRRLTQEQACSCLISAFPGSRTAANGIPARRRRRWPPPWRPRPGPGWRCPGASGTRCSACCASGRPSSRGRRAAKLGVLRALVRDDDQPLPGGGYHGDLPEGWTKSLTHEVALALSMPAVSADRADVAGVGPGRRRLPGIGALLAAGALTLAKAKAVDEALNAAQRRGRRHGRGDDPAGAARQDLRAGRQARRPGGAHRRPGVGGPPPRGRRAAQVPGDDVPRGVRRGRRCPAATCPPTRPWPRTPASAPAPRSTRTSGAFPDDTRMDQFRATAYLDLLNGIAAEARIASGPARAGTPARPRRARQAPDQPDAADSRAAVRRRQPALPDDGAHGRPEGRQIADSGPDDSGPDDGRADER